MQKLARLVASIPHLSVVTQPIAWGGVLQTVRFANDEERVSTALLFVKEQEAIAEFRKKEYEAQQGTK